MRASARRYRALDLLRPVTALSTLAMLIAMAPAFGQTVPDSAAPAANKPSVVTSANGTPIVNIVAPNGAGVSHNKYSEFNVSSKGLVLNNSVLLNTSQIAGLMLGNPNLKTSGPATLILNEVTGTNRSVLAGYLEVNGQPAAVIIANPNGITCNGCGFINTPRMTLTTGRPALDAKGALKSLAVDGGDITIEGAGLDATRVDRFELVTRAIQLNGIVRAHNLLASGGTQNFAYAASQSTSRTVAGAAPLNFFLDSSALGGMYAGRIRIVGNEHGLGIRAPENMAASAGDMDLLADGRLVLKNASASGTITINSGSDGVDVAGILYSDKDLGITAAKDIGVADKAVIGAFGQVNLTGSNLTLGKAVIAAGRKSDGTFSVGSGSASLQFTGSVSIASGALLHGGNSLDVRGGSLISRGQLTSDGTLLLSVVRLDNDGGQIKSQSSLAVEGASGGAATTISNGTGSIESVAGKLKLQAGAIDSNGTLASGKALTIASDTSFTNGHGGQVASGLNLTIRAVTTISGDGIYRAISGGVITAGTITVSDMQVGSKLSIKGVALQNNGMLAADTISLGLSGAIHNATGATLQTSDRLTVTSPILDNKGAILTQNALLARGGVADGLGAFTNAPGARIVAGSISANFGTSANDGVMTSRADLLLAGGALSNSSEITATGNTVLSLARVSNSGTISGSSLLATVSGTLTNAAASVLQANTALDLRAGDIANYGRIRSGGTLNLAANTLLNDHAFITSAGDVSFGGVVAGTRAVSLRNLSGTIESIQGNIAIAVGTLDNIGDGVATHQTSQARYYFVVNTNPPPWLPRLLDYISPAGYNQLYDGGRTHEYAWVPSPAKLAQILSENHITAEQLTPAILNRYVPTSAATFDPTQWEIVIPDEAGRAPAGSYVYSNDEGDVITTPNTPGQILTDHGNIAIDANLLHNKQSKISAVGNMRLTGGSVLNEGLTLNRSYSLGLSYFNDTVRAMGWDRGPGGFTNWFSRGNPGPRLVFSTTTQGFSSTITATGAITGNLSGTFANIGTPAR